VEKAGLFMAHHPVLVSVAFGALVGFGGFQAFRAGMTYAGLRSAVAEFEQAASEALGG
jgi:hypothetical protein